MPQAQKLLSKTLLYPTDTGECSHGGLISTENSFHFAAENQKHSPAPGCWAPGDGCGFMVRVAWGTCGPVLAEQRVAVMGRGSSPLGWAWMGIPRVTPSAPSLAPKPSGAAVGFGFLVMYRR